MINSVNTYIEYSNTKRFTIPMRKPTNYRTFPQLTTDYFVKQGEKSLPFLQQNLDNNRHVVLTLYTLDRIQEAKTADVSLLYPSLSKYNKTRNPEEQTFLAGIYRKTLIPDAFGPLVAMLIQNSLTPQKSYFDPNEEIGGALLEYQTKWAEKTGKFLNKK